jgi:hypothetical protein
VIGSLPKKTEKEKLHHTSLIGSFFLWIILFEVLFNNLSDA